MPGQTKTDTRIRQRPVGVVVCPRTDMTALLLACEPMRAVNRFLQSPSYELVFVAASGAPVRGENGTITWPMTTFDDASADFDLLIVAASPDPGEIPCHHLSRFLRRHAARGARLCGLGGGVLKLAAAGLVDGYRVAVHERYRAQVTRHYKRVELANAIYAIDRNRLTCGGVMAAHDLFLAVVKGDHGNEMVRFVEADIISQPARAPETGSERVEEGKSALACCHMRRVEALMASNIRDPLSIQEIADRLGVSLRLLQMLSRRHYDETLSNRYLGIRLRAAQWMLVHSDRSIVEIAAETGFSSSSAFGRAFKRQLHTSASSFRVSFRRAGSQPEFE